MKRGIVKQIKEILKKFDYFGVQFNFNYKSKEKYHSTTGGVGFICFLVIAITYAAIYALPLVKREKMSIIYYQIQLSETDSINFEEHSNNLAIGVGSCSRLKKEEEFWELFNLTINHVQFVKENGNSKKTRFPISYKRCDKADFYNHFNDSFDILGLEKFFCPVERNFTLEGIYTDPLFQYLEISLLAKNDSKETYDRIKEILSDECDLTFYTIDIAFQLSNYSYPVKKFMISEFISLKYNEYSKMNSYFQIEQFDSYQNYLLDNRERNFYMGMASNDFYSVFKGENRFDVKTEDYNIFARIYIRAGMKRSIVERRYMKLTDFAADVSSILSTLLLILFVIFTYLNSFFAYQSVIKNIFKFSGAKKGCTATNDLRKTICQRGLLTELKDIRTRENNYICFSDRTSKVFPFKSTDISSNSKLFEMEKKNNNNIGQAQFVNRIKRNQINFSVNIIELIIIRVFPYCQWRSLREKNLLLKKAYKKLFFQSDIMNYLKNIQLLELLNYTILEPYEYTILQFLSKPSISLAQREDIYDKIHSANEIQSKEIEDIYFAIRTIVEKKEKNSREQRLFDLTKNEVSVLIKKLKSFSSLGSIMK